MARKFTLPVNKLPSPTIHQPRGKLPVLLSVPHSGREYPDWLIALATAGKPSLATLEDPFVDRLVWRALHDMADLYRTLRAADTAGDMVKRADALKQAILTKCVQTGAPGSSGSIIVSATDGKNSVFTDIPPGSLFKLPSLGFVAQDDPVFVRTYDWLHSRNYQYSYSQQPFGFPGSYRLPFTTSWTVADHLLLTRGRDQALKTLLASPWDGGIISEGIDPVTAKRDTAGRAFATAAGYIAHAICEVYCVARK